ncbi:MAG: hypothetical protein JWN44_3850 [Myxococcales bacterium]|nr:hypothetical protein [Myxococcales bacterium]
MESIGFAACYDLAMKSQPPVPPAPPEGPAWIRDTIALAREEAQRFGMTAVGFMRRPGGFSADWLAGRQRALNPLAFVASALAISSGVGMLLRGGDSAGVLTSISAALVPYLYYAAVGILCHPLLRAAGSTRRLSASIAVALFAGGGPGLVAALSFYLLVAVRIALFPDFHESLLAGIPAWAMGPFFVLAYGPFVYYLTALALALAGLHAVGRARAAAAVLFSLVLIGFALGAAHATTRLAVGAPHLVVTLRGHLPIPDIWF